MGLAAAPKRLKAEALSPSTNYPKEATYAREKQGDDDPVSPTVCPLGYCLCRAATDLR